ncbi:MAG: hypothetical protein L3J86_02170, partial [Thermoplasmata archaeon]|nr:hypothetical protein [Thermoplasmata archaeon]
DLSELASLGSDRDGWRPAVVSTSTQTSTGLPELWAAIEAHEQFLDVRHLRETAERHRLAQEIIGRVADRVGRELRVAVDRDPALQKLLDAVVRRTIDPHSAAERLFRDTRPRA